MAVPPTSSFPPSSSNETEKSRLSLPQGEPALDAAQEPATSDPVPSPTTKRTKNPGIRIVGGRIYDSEHGITCHQCRQKTRDFAAACKGMRRDNKPCTIKFCHKCLLNRYGEKAEEVSMVEGWKCPKCRNVCNCSFCMKKKGHRPTGILVHAAKATGFSSVLDLLHHEGPDGAVARKAAKEAQPSPRGSPVPNKKRSETSKRRCNKESCHGEPMFKKPAATDIEKKEKRRLAKKKKFDNKNGDAFNNCGAEVKQEEGLQGKVSNEASSDQTNEKAVWDGNNKKRSTTVDSDKLEARLPEVRKKKQQAIDIAISIEGSQDGHVTTEPTTTSMPNVKVNPSAEIFKPRKHGIRSFSEPTMEDVVLPHGIPLLTIAGIELPEEVMGLALQFLEFCNAFAECLDLTDGQSEAILRELVKGRVGRRMTNSMVVQFHIKLLSIIQNDAGEKSLSQSPSRENSWLQALGKCIDESQCDLTEFPLNFSVSSSFVYDDLDPSTKLRVVNFLCDKTLSTEELRRKIVEENTRFLEKKKEISEKVLAAKKKERDLKQKLKDDVANAMISHRDGDPLSVIEHDNFISEIRIKAEKAHSELVETINLLTSEKHRTHSVRTEPLLLQGSGQAYWKFKRDCNSSNILLQKFENWDSIASKDKWFICNDDEGKIIEKHILSVKRNQKRKKYKSFQRNVLEDGKEVLEQKPLNDSETPNCLNEIRLHSL